MLAHLNISVAQAKVIVASARVRRIARFIDQLGLSVCQRCLECGLPTSPVEAFMTEIFGKMVRSKEDFSLIELLEMLVADHCREEIFERYRRKIEP